jgi:hypothetical protein
MPDDGPATRGSSRGCQPNFTESPPAYRARSPSSSSIRISWLYFATGSERAGAPVLICPTPVIDEYRLVINPVLAGEGLNIFRRSTFTSRACRRLPPALSCKSMTVHGDARGLTEPGQLSRCTRRQHGRQPDHSAAVGLPPTGGLGTPPRVSRLLQMGHGSKHGDR